MSGHNEVRIKNEATGGEKGRKDERFDLLPWGALAEVATLYGKGAEKYEDHNWRKGYDWSLSAGALARHFAAFMEGEDYDQETGCHHLTSVVFHALALLTFKDEHPELDDRFTPLPEVVEAHIRRIMDEDREVFRILAQDDGDPAVPEVEAVPAPLGEQVEIPVADDDGRIIGHLPVTPDDGEEEFAIEVLDPDTGWRLAKTWPGPYTAERAAEIVEMIERQYKHTLKHRVVPA